MFQTKLRGDKYNSIHLHTYVNQSSKFLTTYALTLIKTKKKTMGKDKKSDLRSEKV